MGLIHKFVLKSDLRIFYRDCGIRDFLLILDLCIGKNKSYQHSGAHFSADMLA